ncbi:putative transcription repressor PLATZ family [Lupinus albus]|uniref:Putative transcription repressor PLATZ family n=1 Tax=Lupinus albus TaxID=3870 RepID=A0A6A4P9D0_LUPAL|nr:putative transcription repressor PLATZ family [Lupinus albus]
MFSYKVESRREKRREEEEEIMVIEDGYDNNNVKPAWLERLVGETFFSGCGVHLNQRKNEKNVFCLHCCLSICPHCFPSHRLHPLLQVRRYVYQNVVRLYDLEKLINCSNIQPYTINSAKVIFLNQRPQSKSCKGAANACYTCDRILQEPFHFCSLSCKVFSHFSLSFFVLFCSLIFSTKLLFNIELLKCEILIFYNYNFLFYPLSHTGILFIFENLYLLQYTKNYNLYLLRLLCKHYLWNPLMIF